MLSEEKINLNYVSFVNKLKQYGIYTQELENDSEFNELLKNSSAFINADSGGAYEGSLVEHTTHIAVIAYNINKMLFSEVQVSLDSLIKVCYVHQISKALMVEKNDTDWEVKKGKLFRFKDELPAIKCGEYSIYLCNKYGITLTEEEYEAILSVDKIDDVQTKYFSNMLSQVLRTAIELSNTERKLRYKIFLKSK